MARRRSGLTASQKATIRRQKEKYLRRQKEKKQTPEKYERRTLIGANWSLFHIFEDIAKNAGHKECDALRVANTIARYYEESYLELIHGFDELKENDEFSKNYEKTVLIKRFASVIAEKYSEIISKQQIIDYCQKLYLK